MRSTLRFFAWTLLTACGARSSLPFGDDASQGGAGGGSTAVTVGGGGTGGTVNVGGAGGSGGSGAGGSGVGGVEQLALGAGHSCLRTFEGDVYCWGRNANGQLGDGTFDDALAPVRAELPGPATFLAAGSFHTCAALLDGEIYCWGRNAHGQLGNGFVDADPPKGRSIPEPVIFEVPEKTRVLSLGERHTCAIRGESLACWGSGAVGAIGTFDDPVPVPRFVPAGPIAELAAGGFFTCALPASDPADPFVPPVSCMGANDLAQSGSASGAVIGELTPIATSDFPHRALAAGMGNHACAILGDALACWGANASGQLGRGTETTAELPGPVLDEDVPLGSIDAVAPGLAHTCALRNGRVLCWGENGSGQLGVSEAGLRSATPLVVSALADTAVVAIGAGSVHSCAYVSPEEIWCWGGNDFGQLGDGTTVASDVPVRVMLP
jgi:alpha-tubulin suppressor-like RCC1 family protein